MSSKQIRILRRFDRMQVQAMQIAGQWVWRQEIMRSRRLADEIYDWLFQD